MNKKKISIVFPLNYESRGPYDKYMPMIEKLDDKIECIYGIKRFGRKNIKNQKMVLSWFPSLVSWHIVDRMQKIIKFPMYYRYLANIFCFDFLMAKKVARDNSKIIFSSPLLKRTIKMAKKVGKIVVIEAGNSEPKREFFRIDSDYNEFKIKKKYIYGDSTYKNIRIFGLENADYVVSISNLSLNTYRQAGYNLNKFKLISLAGTNFEPQIYRKCRPLKKAFISTGFHSFIKGTHRLLLAWKKANIKDIPLVLVGDVCEDIKEFIDKYGPFDNVVFTGPRSDLEKWYLDYEAVGILLSLSEGAGRVTPEMMSFGFPMVTSIDASCDLVRDGENGFIVDVYKEDKIIEKLKYFADDWSRVRAMRKSVLSSVSSRTVKEYSLELADFLEGL